jgi:hemolysin D
LGHWFRAVGQPAEVKVDTFNFTRYGLLHGKVPSVSRDTIVRDKPATDRSGDKTLGTDTISSEENQELSFSTRVPFDRVAMQVDDKLMKLTPGMAVTVEIKTSSRSVFGYLLSPLIKYRQEGLRER